MITRIALTILLLIVLVVMAVEAIRLDGLAAPILGR